MLGAIILLLLAFGCGRVGIRISNEATLSGGFKNLPDQILMMTTLIMSSVFLVGSLVLAYLSSLLRQLKRINKLGHVPS